MTTQFYRFIASDGSPIGLYGPMRVGWYAVDGVVADPPGDTVQLQIIRESLPDDLAATQIAEPKQEADIAAKTYTFGWSIRDLTEEEVRARLPSITPRQMRKWLLLQGSDNNPSEKVTIAKGVINSIPDPRERASAQTEWEYAVFIERSHPLVAAIGSALGLDNAGIDQAFKEAALL